MDLLNPWVRVAVDSEGVPACAENASAAASASVVRVRVRMEFFI
jgi:hypothetical protein